MSEKIEKDALKTIDYKDVRISVYDDYDLNCYQYRVHKDGEIIDHCTMFREEDGWTIDNVIAEAKEYFDVEQRGSKQ